MGPDVISSRTNARVKQLRAAFQGHARLSGGMVAIEGDHLLEEALRSGTVLKTAFVSERREVPKIVPRGVEVLRLTEEVFGSVVETQSPQGVAALMVPPVFVLDDVMGSVFRVPVVPVTASELSGAKARGVRLIAAVGAGGCGVTVVQEMDFRGACAVMIGNE